MRWMELAVLLVMGSGCTVHVVQEPVTPVMVSNAPAEPSFAPPAARAARARARPFTESPKARRVRASAANALPREPRSGQMASAAPPTPRKAKAPPQRPAQKPRGRFKLQPNDVMPVKSEPAQSPRKQRARSASVAQTQQHPLDLGQ